MNVGINSSGDRFRDWAEVVISRMWPDSAISHDAVEVEPISYKPSEKVAATSEFRGYRIYQERMPK